VKLKPGDRVTIRKGSTVKTKLCHDGGESLEGARAVVVDESGERPNLDGVVQERVTVRPLTADGAWRPVELPTDYLRQDGVLAAAGSGTRRVFGALGGSSAKWARIFGR
jgi:hypothetical protein